MSELISRSELAYVRMRTRLRQETNSPTPNGQLAYVGELTIRRRRVGVGEFARRRVDRIPQRDAFLRASVELSSSERRDAFLRASVELLSSQRRDAFLRASVELSSSERRDAFLRASVELSSSQRRDAFLRASVSFSNLHNFN